MIPSSRLMNYLRAHGIAYERLLHAEAFTARAAAAAECIDRHHQAKVVMVKVGGQPVMAVIPADRQLDLRKLERITGAGVTLASETDFAALFPDCEVGAMPPFGNLYGLPTYVDRELADEDYIAFEAGNYTQSIKVRYADYERLVNPQVFDLVIG